MRNDDQSRRQPASQTPETEAIDASWDDDPEAANENFSRTESGTPVSISQRVTVPAQLDQESGTYECPGADAPQAPSGLVVPDMPVLIEEGRSAGELDDPLIDVRPDPDFDTETPSQDEIPIAERITPVQEPPAELLELDPISSRPIRGTQDSAMQDMRERYSVGDFTGALLIAESVLAVKPDDPDALRYAQSCRDVLLQMYSARLAPLDQIVEVCVPSDQIRWLSLDHRAGFMLSLVDGVSSIEEVLDICGMPRLDALRILYMLFEQRVITLAARK